jgi:hypothetical protein
MGFFSVGPPGLEPRTCGLRVRRDAAGEKPRMPFEPRVCTCVIPFVPILSRSFTGMGRGLHIGLHPEAPGCLLRADSRGGPVHGRTIDPSRALVDAGG